MEGLSSLTRSVLTAVKSRTVLVVHVSVLGVGWAILQHVYLLRFYICFKFVTTEILLFTDYICCNKTCLAVFERLYFNGVAQ